MQRLFLLYRDITRKVVVSLVTGQNVCYTFRKKYLMIDTQRGQMKNGADGTGY